MKEESRCWCSWWAHSCQLTCHHHLFLSILFFFTYFIINLLPISSLLPLSISFSFFLWKGNQLNTFLLQEMEEKVWVTFCFSTQGKRVFLRLSPSCLSLISLFLLSLSFLFLSCTLFLFLPPFTFFLMKS